MNLKKILSYAAFFFGLAILVACMFIWGGEKNNVFYLNLSVFVVAYCMFFGPLLMGHSQSADDENKIGSWGLKWLVLTLYPIAAVAAVFAAITDELKASGKVQLVGFGTFAVKHRDARTGRNPRTNSNITIPAADIPVFKAGKALKDAVAK